MARNNNATPNTQPTPAPSAPKKKARPLSVGRAIDKLRELADTTEERRRAFIAAGEAAFDAAEQKRRDRVLKKLSDDDQAFVVAALERVTVAADEPDKTAWLHKDPPETSGRVEVERS